MAEEAFQRRLAAILAADVVGYSRLMETDEAGTLGALKARRKGVLDPLVAKHHGRVFKVTGDGVLVEFGSAVNAVLCAVELQRGMAAANGDQPEGRHIVLRIGVNLGDVMVVGSDLYGDGVNIAARLEALAEPGGILVSGTAYDHIKNKIKAGFEDLGIQNLKNIDEPVRAYRVSGVPIGKSSVLKSGADKPSIAVLPFTNMSGNAEQDYFTEGITEDIITELSRFNGLYVIARHSSFAYRGRSVDARQIGRELGVQYLLEGSIRVVGARARITAQLVDTNGGSHRGRNGTSAISTTSSRFRTRFPEPLQVWQCCDWRTIGLSVSPANRQIALQPTNGGFGANAHSHCLPEKECSKPKGYSKRPWRSTPTTRAGLQGWLSFITWLHHIRVGAFRSMSRMNWL